MVAPLHGRGWVKDGGEATTSVEVKSVHMLAKKWDNLEMGLVSSVHTHILISARNLIEGTMKKDSGREAGSCISQLHAC